MMLKLVLPRHVEGLAERLDAAVLDDALLYIVYIYIYAQ